MSQQYDIGDMVRCSVVFKNLNNEEIDPTVIVLKIKKPDNSIVEYSYSNNSVIKNSTGNYYYDFLITLDGMHIFKWIGSGNINAVEESTFFVNPTKF